MIMISIQNIFMYATVLQAINYTRGDLRQTPNFSTQIGTRKIQNNYLRSSISSSSSSTKKRKLGDIQEIEIHEELENGSTLSMEASCDEEGVCECEVELDDEKCESCVVCDDDLENLTLSWDCPHVGAHYDCPSSDD